MTLALLLALATSPETRRVQLTETMILQFQVLDLREKLIQKELETVQAQKLDKARVACTFAKIEFDRCAIDLERKVVLEVPMPAKTKAP